MKKLACLFFAFGLTLSAWSTTPQIAYNAFCEAIKEGNLDAALARMVPAPDDLHKDTAKNFIECYKEEGYVPAIKTLNEAGDKATLVLESDALIVFTKDGDLWKFNLEATIEALIESEEETSDEAQPAVIDDTLL